jgi:hypothetical protein
MTTSNMFHSDWDHSVKMSLKADEIYKSIYPIASITRLTRDDKPHILDKEFSIDKILQLQNGMIITLQEKMLRGCHAHYDCFTLEYKNNSWGDFGEYFKLCADLYCTAYGDDDFDSFYLFKTIDIKNAIIKKELEGIVKQNQYHSSASFIAYPFKQFKDDWFIYKKPYSDQPAGVSKI